MVRTDSEMVDYGFNSLFVYFRCFVRDLSTLRVGERGLEQNREGAGMYTIGHIFRSGNENEDFFDTVASLSKKVSPEGY
jgi:hypothetical protein